MDIASLSIACINEAVITLRYLYQCVQDSKEFGDDIRRISTRIATESARLQAFRQFLEDKAFDGKTRFEMLPEAHRDAVLGMVQELLIIFGTYTEILKKYGILQLQDASKIDHLPTREAASLDTATLKRRGTEASRTVQETTTIINKAYWGVFRKKNVSRIVTKLEEWNNKLQDFLLCGLCFLDGAKLVGTKDHSTLDTLRLTTGLQLRSIITGNTASSIQILREGFTLAPAEENSRFRTITTTGDNGESTTNTCYVEYKPYKTRRGSTEPPPAMVKRVLNLGNLLCQPRAAEAGFYTLQCKHIVEEKGKGTLGRGINRFAFLFSLPTETRSPPVSLLDAIKSSQYIRPTLGERFRIAHTLASTIFQLHSVGWLHKSIRTENAIVFPKSENQLEYIRQCIVGFEFSRDENDTSTTEQDDILERNIYRHPDRQGPPDTRFSLLHDIYSLGVVLLEIGLWRPVISYDSSFPDMVAEEITETLEKHAKQRLPHYMGSAYTNAVLVCMNGSLADMSSDESNSGTVSANIEHQREKIQLAYHKKVIGGIESGLALMQFDCEENSE